MYIITAEYKDLNWMTAFPFFLDKIKYSILPYFEKISSNSSCEKVYFLLFHFNFSVLSISEIWDSIYLRN